MLRRSVVEAVSRPAVPVAKLGSGQRVAVDNRVSCVIRLGIERSPTEITRRNKTRVDDRTELKGEQQDRNDDAHRRNLLRYHRIRTPSALKANCSWAIGPIFVTG